VVVVVDKLLQVVAAVVDYSQEHSLLLKELHI